MSAALRNAAADAYEAEDSEFGRVSLEELLNDFVPRSVSPAISTGIHTHRHSQQIGDDHTPASSWISSTTVPNRSLRTIQSTRKAKLREESNEQHSQWGCHSHNSADQLNNSALLHDHSLPWAPSTRSTGLQILDLLEQERKDFTTHRHHLADSKLNVSDRIQPSRATKWHSEMNNAQQVDLTAPTLQRECDSINLPLPSPRPYFEISSSSPLLLFPTPCSSSNSLEHRYTISPNSSPESLQQTQLAQQFLRQTLLRRFVRRWFCKALQSDLHRRCVAEMKKIEQLKVEQQSQIGQRHENMYDDDIVDVDHDNIQSGLQEMDKKLEKVSASKLQRIIPIPLASLPTPRSYFV